MKRDKPSTSPSSSSSPKPPKICFQFRQGTCKFGNNCKYSHDRNNVASPPSTPKSSPSKPWTSSSSSSSPSSPSSPNSKAFGTLGFLNHQEKLDVNQMRLFAMSLGQLLEDRGADELLNVLTLKKDKDGKPLFGLNHVQAIAESAFDLHVGRPRRGASTISFQRVVLPLLNVIFHDSILRSVLSSSRRQILVGLRQGTFETRLVTLCRQIQSAGSNVVDNLYTSYDREQDEVHVKVWEPATFADVLCPIAKFFHAAWKADLETAVDVHKNNEFVTLVDDLLEIIDSFGPVPDDLDKVARALRTFVDGAHHATVRETAKQNEALRLQRFGAKPPTSSQSPESSGGPGDVGREQPRHDNDFVEFEKIQIAPTAAEVFSKELPFLPPNNSQGFAKIAYLAEHAPTRRVLETHFRLMREDLIRPLRFAVQMLKENGGVRARGLDGGRYRAPMGSVRGGAIDNNAVDLYVYRAATIGAIAGHTRNGITYAINFKQPRSLDNKARNEIREFWDRSRRLQVGALVCLWRQGTAGQEPDVEFAIVCAREVADLAGKDGVCKILVTSVSANGYSEKLLRFKLGLSLDNLAEVQGDEILLIEPVGNSYFAYAPVLQALQRLVVAELPFPALLADADPTLAQDRLIRPPEGLYNDSSVINFTPILIQPHLQLSQVPVTNVGELERALRLLAVHSTFDASQIKALKAALTQDVVLIQGPPGTGKTWVGIKIVQLLLANAKFAAGPVPNPVGRGVPIAVAQTLPVLPIVCVCYTNHALDQFLEGLVNSGVDIDSIIRLGGRSKSPKFQERPSLNMLANTFVQKFKVKQIHEELEEVQGKLRVLEEDLQELASGGRRVVEEVLQLTHSDFLEWIKERDAQDLLEGFRRQDKKSAFDLWFEGRNLENQRQDPQGAVVPPRPLAELYTRVNPWEITREEHDRIIADALRTYRLTQMAELDSLMSQYQETKQRLEELYSRANLQVLQKARIVAMTTTGAAKFQSLISALRPAIIVCEEAAEVLESHVLATLSEHTKQLILIGDHLQLRPKAQVYDLEYDSLKGYNLDRSLFERLAAGPMASRVVTLTTQRRMRPIISDLIRHTLYPKLIDHSSVSQYPDVKGALKNVFWLDHRILEGGGGNLDEAVARSKVNEHEVGLVVGLARYFIAQGYKGEDLTILTPYLGQLAAIRRALSRNFKVMVTEADQEDLEKYIGEEVADGSDDEGGGGGSSTEEEEEEIAPNISPSKGKGKGKEREKDKGGKGKKKKKAKKQKEVETKSMTELVRVATIDNFQGEESQIILISMVRSNQSGRLGFVKSPNRSNVLISRAKHGMYIVGNADHFTHEKKGTNMWRSVVKELRDNECLGEKLPLVCQLHPDTITEVSSLADFARIPDGGCNRPCGERMPCGHSCPKSCHPDDRGHKGVSCQEPCMRIRDKEVCPERHPCPKKCCESCGYCMERVPFVVPSCGHLQTVPCYERLTPTLIRCAAPVTFTMPCCGHSVTSKCWEKANRITDPSSCPTDCKALLECGHICRGTCGTCLKGHIACTNPCKRPLPCGHECQEERCHGRNECPPCKQECQYKCPHGRCGKKCGESCVPCTSPCAWKCKHGLACPLTCAAPCLRLPCSNRCDEILSCKHRCPSLCGEVCPSSDYCPECPNATHQGQVVDFIEGTTLGQIDPNVSPLIKLSCGHAFTVASLDGIFAMDTAYSRQGDEGPWTETIPFDPSKTYEIVKCPLCRTRITNVSRYGRILKKIAMDLSERRYIALAHSVLRDKIEGPLGELNHTIEALVATPIPSSKSLKDELRSLCNELTDSVKQLLSAAEKKSGMKNSPLLMVWESALVHFKRTTPGDDHEAVMALVSNGVPRPDGVFQCGLTSAIANLSFLELRLRLFHLFLSEHPSTKRFEILGKQVAKFDRVRSLMDTAIQLATKDQLTRRCSQYLGQAIFHRFELVQHALPILNACVGQGIGTQELRDRLAQHLQDAIDLSVHVNDPEISRSVGLLRLADLLGKCKIPEVQYLPVTAEEMKVIHAVMSRDVGSGVGSFGGHWYTCPNGHVYTIGECGGAMQESRCYECGARVGGSNHQVTTGNQVATDFLRKVEATDQLPRQ